MTKRYDALIIGGGHNGLTCAFYLARAGLSVRVLERRHVVGGAAVTEEFHPGFRNSTASYTVSLLQPKVIADMKLADHGYRVIERPISNFLPQEDGGYLKLGGGPRKRRRNSASSLPPMPRPCPTITRRWKGRRRAARPCLKIPPNVGGGLRTLIAAPRRAGPPPGPAAEHKRDLLDMFTKSARQFLDQWFESEAVKAAFGFDAVVGNYARGFDTPGSAYVLLHHVFGEVNGKKGAWGHAVGGMGAITRPWPRPANAGVEISLEAPVAKRAGRWRQGRGREAGSGEEIVADRRRQCRPGAAL
jgi:phytoene dehydrogenase-like protein